MKTLVLNGSPHENGNGMAIISRMCEFLQGEVKIISVYDRNISACRDCRYCREHPRCAIEDDMEEVYEYLEEADNLIISSPIHLSSLSAPLLALLGRLPELHRHYQNPRAHDQNVQTAMKRKNGVYILTGGGEVFQNVGAVEGQESSFPDEEGKKDDAGETDQTVAVRDKMSDLSDAARLAGKSVKRWLQREEDKKAAVKEAATAMASWSGRMAKNFGEAAEDTTKYLEPLLHTIFKRLNTRRVGWIRNFSTSFAPAVDNTQTMNQAKSAALLLNRLYNEKIQKESDKEQLDKEKETRRIPIDKVAEWAGATEPTEAKEPQKQADAKKEVDTRAERERIRMEKQAERERARYR